MRKLRQFDFPVPGQPAACKEQEAERKSRYVQTSKGAFCYTFLEDWEAVDAFLAMGNAGAFAKSRFFQSLYSHAKSTLVMQSHSQVIVSDKKGKLRVNPARRYVDRIFSPDQLACIQCVVNDRVSWRVAVKLAPPKQLTAREGTCEWWQQIMNVPEA